VNLWREESREKTDDKRKHRKERREKRGEQREIPALGEDKCGVIVFQI
jgi:hypothetical protein